MSRPNLPANPPDPSLSGVGVEFGFDLDDETWTRRVAEYSASPTLGRLGEYELIGELGRGGQGVVFKARQPRTGRLIAIKRLSAGAFATPEMRARFDREIDAAATLDHPNIVTVFGTEVVDGQQLLAMKWVDGVPIDCWARPRDGPRRAIREVLEVFAVVCDAVHHAHQRGVIHRDLKPSNILVDKETHAFVLDFGLAKVANETAHARTITLTGGFMGTPVYAAPEQIRGDARAVDVRTDVYALGAILYRLLTGVLPFEDTGGLPALMQNVLHREPARPSSHDAELNREVDVIVLKALAKDKDQRYSSVDDLADDLRRFLAGQAVLAHPPSTMYQVRKFVRRHRAGVAASVVFVILLVAATVVSTAFFFRSERERRRADEQLIESRRQQERAEREARKASESNRFVTDMLARADRGAEKGNPNVTVREVLDTAATELETGKIAYEPEVEASVRYTIAKTYSALGLDASAEPHYVRALGLLREAYGENDPRVAECMTKLASHFRGQGRLADAEPLIEGALRIRQALSANLNDPLLADAYASLGILKRHLGKFDEAESIYLKALEMYRTALGPDDENVGTVQRSLGVLYLFMNRPQDAEQRLRKALELFERIPGDHAGDIAGAKENLAMTLQKLNGSADPAGEVESLLRDVLAANVQLLGPTHPTVAVTRLNLANVLLLKGQVEEAAQISMEAVASANTERLPHVINLMKYLVHERLGQPAKAEAVLHEALERREPFLGVSHPAIGHIRLNLGILLTVQGKFEEAEPFLMDAETILLSVNEPVFGNARLVREKLVSLYEQWNAAEPGNGYAVLAAEWKAKLGDK